MRKWTLAIKDCTYPFPNLRDCCYCLTCSFFFPAFYSIEAELSRLNRNKERRFAREKQKGVVRGSTGESPADGQTPTTPAKSAGTQRKCANCGQVGHIKTNKKSVKFLVPPDPQHLAPGSGSAPTQNENRSPLKITLKSRA